MQGIPSPLGPVSGYASYGASPPTGTDGSVDLWLLPTPPGYAYAMTATPPPDGPYATTGVAGVQVSGDTVVPITLSRANRLSGRVLDPLGQGVPSVWVEVRNESVRLAAGANASGAYAFTLAPGSYVVTTGGGRGPNPVAVPDDYYYRYETPLELTGDTTLNLELPFKRVTVRVQSQDGSPVAGVTLAAGSPWMQGIPSPLGPVSGYASYGASPPTETDGSVDLWLLPTPPGYAYAMTATPPPDGRYAVFGLSGLRVESNKTLTIVLRWLHDPPVTTATLSPEADPGGFYQDPETVTLQAAAYPGFSATTYFQVDGSAPLIYSGPFGVTGIGEHTVRYWSVDNAGVVESAQFMIFTIRPATITRLIAATRQAGVVGWITKAGTIVSLQAKLQAAEAARARGLRSTAINQLEAFLRELAAQRGKAVVEEGYMALSNEALRVIALLR
jgi:hypothetical protein